MNLKISDICEILNVPEKTVNQWIKEQKIPYYQINKQYRFNEAEINEWILRNNYPVTEKILLLRMTQKPVVLKELLMTGGFYYEIEGTDLQAIFRHTLTKIQLPEGLDEEWFLSTLMEREEIMPTAVGHGIAFPHPRSPLISSVSNECIYTIFLKNPLPCSAADGLPLNTLFIIVSSNPKRHLEILSKLSLLCSQDSFRHLLAKKSEAVKILDFIEKQEKIWEERQEGNI